jgi:hypothetical protein
MNISKMTTANWFLSSALMSVLATRVAHAETEQPIPAASAVTGTSEEEEVRRLYRASYESSSAGNLREGKTLLLRAWAIRHTYDIASALGQLELALDEPRDAAEHLDFALRNFPPQQSAAALEDVRADFAKAKARVGSVSVHVSLPGAQVFVDGKFVGTAPLAAPLFLDPGKHTIAAEEAGARIENPIVARANVAESLFLTVPEPQQPEPKDRPSENSTHASSLPYILGGGVVAAGLGVGFAFAIAASSKTDRAESLRTQLEPGECFQSREDSGPCAELRSVVDSHNRFRDISTVGFVFSGAALAATLGYWGITSTPRSGREKTARSLHMSASASQRHAAISLRGSF